jgi:hypothetical protein
MEMNSKTPQQQPLPYEDDEIDIIALAKTLWKGRKIIIKTTLIFASMGLFVALTTPAQYTSTVVVKPILSDSKTNIGGGLGGLAAMAGINLGGASVSAEIHPTLYPQIVESYSFQKALMQTKLQISGVAEELTYENYFLKHYKPSILQIIKKYSLGLPGLIMSSFEGKPTGDNSFSHNLTLMSEDDLKLIAQLKEQISIEINEKGGYVALSATMPEALASTKMVIKAQGLLQEVIIAHKAKKANEDLIFIEERFSEKKEAFNKAQQQLAIYRDANKNVNTAIALTEVERLESEYQLAFSVYSELAKQVETQKIQVKEDTPVFAVLKEAIVPLEKSSASKSRTLIIWIFLGCFISLAWVFGSVLISDMKIKWNEK